MYIVHIRMYVYYVNVHYVVRLFPLMNTLNRKDVLKKVDFQGDMSSKKRRGYWFHGPQIEKLKQGCIGILIKPIVIRACMARPLVPVPRWGPYSYCHFSGSNAQKIWYKKSILKLKL